MQPIIEFITTVWEVTGEMAPYLIFGFLIAGVLSELLPTSFVRRHLSGKGFGPVVKASLIGVPLPLCSCGVIPTGVALRDRGASRAATVSFLVSTPQTGVDSILVTAGLLGWFFAIYRTMLAFLSGIVAGMIAALVGKEHQHNTASGESSKDEDSKTPSTAATSCCCGCSSSNMKKEPETETATQEPVKSCCSGDDTNGGNGHNGHAAPGVGPSSRVLRSLWFAFVHYPSMLAGALLVGILLTGLVSVLIPGDFFSEALGGRLQGGPLGMMLMILVGLPMYVCATASVPLAWILIAKGCTPGMALVFLMTGPATNAAAIAVLWRILGARVTMVYVATIIGMALLGGFLVDWYFSGQVLDQVASLHQSAHMLPGWVRHGSAIILTAMIGYGLIRRKKA